MILKNLIPVFSFVLGVGFAYIFIEPYNGDVLELFQVAYESGKQDGWVLGHGNRSIHDYPFQLKESMCLFLYDHK